MAAILNSKMSVQDANLELPPIEFVELTNVCLDIKMLFICALIIGWDIHKYWFCASLFDILQHQRVPSQTPI